MRGRRLYLHYGLKADYNAKRTILSIMLETVRLNSENLEFSLRKPFNLLRDENLVPLIGASGMPVELFISAIRDFSSKTYIAIISLTAASRYPARPEI